MLYNVRLKALILTSVPFNMNVLDCCFLTLFKVLKRLV